MNFCTCTLMLFFLILLFPFGSSLYIFQNMIEPYLKTPIPTIFLSPGENKYMNLNNYYGGSQLKFQFNAFTDPYIKFSKNDSITNSSAKQISDQPVEFLLFPDQNGLNCTGAMLTDDNKVYSIVITNIYSGQSDISFLSFLKVPDDLNCHKMAGIDSMSIILDCDASDGISPPQFLLVNFYMNNTIKNVDQNYIRINNTYNCANQKAYRNCSRSIKYANNFIYRYCPKSRASACGSLEIFSLNKTNYTSSIYSLITNISTIDGTFPLMIQDMEIYDSQDIFVLDYHFGPYELLFSNTGYQIINNKCPAVLGSSYYNLGFDCFDKSGIHDDFQQCKLIVTSSHYITEMIYSKGMPTPCTFYSRKNLGESMQEIFNTYFSTNYIIIYYTTTQNSSINSLNVYDRNDMNTNILYQLNNLSAGTTLRLLNPKTDFYFSPTILNKLIVFTKNNKQLYLINIGQNVISFGCCNNGLPLDWLHTAYLDYSVINLKGEVKRRDRIYIKFVNFQDPSLFSQNNTLSYQMNLGFLNYKAPLIDFIKGSNQQFSVLRADNSNSQIKNTGFNNAVVSLMLSVEEINSFYPTIVSDASELIFLKIIEMNLNYFFFVQFGNFSIHVQKCLFITEEESKKTSSMSCWNISHEMAPNTGIKDIFSKEDILIVQTVNSSLFSYYFTDATFKYIKLDRMFTIDNQPLNCPTLLFSLVSSHCLCIAYTSTNDFHVSIFMPSNSSDHNNSKIQSYNYTNEYPNEVFGYFDQTLLSSDIILAKGPHCIHILKLSYSSSKGQNSLSTIMVIDNEYTNVTDAFDGFHFNVVKSNLYQRISLLITNYEKNCIVEYNLDDLISPMFRRKYPLYGYQLAKDSYITTVNDAYFIVGARNISNVAGGLFYLVFDVSESTESSLIKIIQTDDFSRIYLVLERNRPISNVFSPEAQELDFLLFNMSQTNQSVFQKYRPVSLKGFLNLTSVQKSIVLNETSKNYSVQSNFNESSSFKYNISINNKPIGNNTVNISYTVAFDYSNTIVGYSDYFLGNPGQNLSLLDLSEQNNATLPGFFSGPVINYEMDNSNPKSSGFNLRTFMELESLWDLNLEVEKFNTRKGKSFTLGNDSRTTVMVIPTDDYVFILKEFIVIMLRMNGSKTDDEFSVVDIFELTPGDQKLTRCSNFETDYSNLTNQNLFLGCSNQFEEPLLYVLTYDSSGFDPQLREIIINGMVSSVITLKIMDYFVFVINQDLGNMNDCSIFIFQIDLPIGAGKNTSNSNGSVILDLINRGTGKSINSNVPLNSIVIPPTNLYILNAESFNVDYLYIYDFELNCFGVMNSSYVYGIILNDQLALYYCEISMNPDDKIDTFDFYNKSLSDFVLKSSTQLQQLDLRSLLDLSFRSDEGAPSITSYWVESNVFGEMFILISTPYELLEIKTSRFYFSGYFEVFRDFQEYSDCLNNQNINSRAALNPTFLAFPCIMSTLYSNTYQTYLKLFLKDGETGNNSMVPISQMMIFPASKFNDFFFAGGGPSGSRLLVINGSDILEYALYESLWLERTMLDRGIPGHESNFLMVKAINNFSVAEVKLHVNNGLFMKNDWATFYGLVVAPLIFCFCGMAALFAMIHYSRNKRKDMLLSMEGKTKIEAEVKPN